MPNREDQKGCTVERSIKSRGPGDVYVVSGLVRRLQYQVARGQNQEMAWYEFR